MKSNTSRRSHFRLAVSEKQFLARITCATRLRWLPLLLLLSLPAMVQAQFNYTINDNGGLGHNPTITITGYTGPGGTVAIPATINGLSVTLIGDYAFAYDNSLNSVTFPNSGIGIAIGNSAFCRCDHLGSVTIGNGVTYIGAYAFSGTPLNSVTIPNSVTSIGDGAFEQCGGLSAITVNALNSFYSSVDGVLFNKSQTLLIEFPGGKAGSYTIPNSVTSIGDSAFTDCTSLKGVFFKGNAPSVGPYAFDGATNVIVYYLPGTTGWEPTFAGRPAVLWNPLMQTSGPAFGVGPAGFGFNITGTADIPIVVEATTNLPNGPWVPLQTLNVTGGASYFSDPNWTNYPARNYRIRSP